MQIQETQNIFQLQKGKNECMLVNVWMLNLKTECELMKV